MKEVTEHPYLTARGLDTRILAHRRFRDRVYIDNRTNTVFPHFDAGGVCGYEIKNRNFTGFASGGEKALWTSNQFPEDTRMIITESAIDAMSHFVVKPSENSFYVSTAGGWGPKTAERLRTFAAELPLEGEVILAYDQDAQGLEYIQKTEVLLEGFPVRIIHDLPPHPETDWNDELRKVLDQSPSKRPHNDPQMGERT